MKKWKKVVISGQEVVVDNEEDRLIPENVTPRIPRNFVKGYYDFNPELTKTLHFIYSYSYKAVKERRFAKVQNNVYTEIQISFADLRRWLGPHRDRQEEKLNQLKQKLKTFSYQFAEKMLLIDITILPEKELNYLAELSPNEAKLKNNQLLFLKRIQAGSRASQVFNLSTLIEYRKGNDIRERRIKQKVLEDLKLFQDMGMIKKVEFLNQGKQVKLMIWKENKSGVGRRIKRGRWKKKAA